PAPQPARPQPSGQQPSTPQAPGTPPQGQQFTRPQPPGSPPLVQQPQKTLTSTESLQRIQDMNRNRATMQGINRNPLPQGQVTVHPDGRQTIAASGGRQISLNSNGTVERVSLRDGKTALFRPNGQVRSVQAGGTQIHYDLRGQRHIMTERSD